MSDLVCVLCLWTRPRDERSQAITVQNGNAVCEEHTDRVTLGDLSRSIHDERQAREHPETGADR